MDWNPEKGFLPEPNVEKIVSNISAFPNELAPKFESKSKIVTLEIICILPLSYGASDVVP